MSRDTRVLRLLCVSDTHLNWKHIDQAALLAPAHDVVLCSGDLGVYNHETKVVSDLVAQADMDEVLRRLEHGHDRPVFYVPGNHDAPSSFDPLLKMGARAVNVHASRLSGKQKKKEDLSPLQCSGLSRSRHFGLWWSSSCLSERLHLLVWIPVHGACHGRKTESTDCTAKRRRRSGDSHDTLRSIRGGFLGVMGGEKFLTELLDVHFDFAAGSNCSSD